MTEGYRTISLPTELVNECEKIVKDKRLGYVNHTDLIRKAVQNHLCTLKTNIAYRNCKEKK